MTMALSLPRLLLLLAVAVAGAPSLADALNLVAYDGVCSGTGVVQSNVPPATCIPLTSSAFSVSFQGSGSVCKTAVYNDGTCSNPVRAGSGTGCLFYPGGLGSAAWWGCRRRSLLGEEEDSVAGVELEMDSENEAYVDPEITGLVYTDDRSEGTWILAADNASELRSVFADVPDADKPTWLEARGASFYAAGEGL